MQKHFLSAILAFFGKKSKRNDKVRQIRGLCGVYSPTKYEIRGGFIYTKGGVRPIDTLRGVK